MPNKTKLLEVKFQTLSPIVDPIGFGLVYQSGTTVEDPAEWNALATAVGNSLTTVPAGAVHAPNFYLNQVVDPGVGKTTVTVYDITDHLDGSPHGGPMGFTSHTVSGGGGPQPEGLCAVITFQAAYGTDVEFGPGTPPSTRPRARDRGRIYFGPLGSSATAVEAGSNRTILSSGCRTDLTKWIKAINSEIVTSNTYLLQVWSRKNASCKPLIETYMDDRVDYQRRRSDQSTVKTIQTLP